MSNLLEILSKESSNTDTIYFYREGVFYKAYERSAYLFVHHVKPFRIKKRFVKSVKLEVVSVGFPTNSLYNYFAKERVVESEKEAKVELGQKIDSEDFEQWRAAIPYKRTVVWRQVATETAGGVYRPLRQIQAAETGMEGYRKLSGGE